MNSYFTKTPKWIRSLYAKQVWSLPNNKNKIYLTFDDGPTPETTEWVLDTLALFNAKATFFCIGKNIEKNPTLFKKIIKSGHSIGNHTFNHEKGWETNNEDYLNSVLETENSISNLEPKVNDSKLFRPPYGKIKRKQTRLIVNKGYKIVMWSVLSWDFDKSINAEMCLKNVIENTTTGDIIVFHDSIKAFEKLQVVLPKALKYFRKNGYLLEKL